MWCIGFSILVQTVSLLLIRIKQQYAGRLLLDYLVQFKGNEIDILSRKNKALWLSNQI